MAVPQAQFMNKIGKLWLPMKDAALASFNGTEAQLKAGLFAKTTYTYQSKEKEEGYVFDNPRLLILGTSPRFIEQYDKEEGGTKLLGWFDTEEGKQFYYMLKQENDPNKSVTLRTFYAVILLDDKLEPLVARPLIVPIKGIAAVHLGQSISAFHQHLEASYSKARKRRLASELPNHDWYKFAIYHPTLGKDILGDNGNDICVPLDFEKLDPTKWDVASPNPMEHTHPMIISGDFAQELKEVGSLYANSFRMYISEKAKLNGFHKVEEGSVVHQWLCGSVEPNNLLSEASDPEDLVTVEVESDSSTSTALAPEANGTPVRTR